MNNTPNDNYVEVTDIRIIKKLLVKLMSDFHEICEENHLMYNVFGGTMLGAVRHKGMIPWDDDIDVVMPRSDYDSFIDLVRKKYAGSYRIYVYPDEDYCYPYAKLALNNTLLIEPLRNRYKKCKLYIDIFPVDGYPVHHEKEYFKEMRRLKFFRDHAIHTIPNPDSFKGRIRTLFAKICEIPSVRYYVEREIKLAKSNDYNTAEYVLLQGAGWCERGKLEKTVFLDRKLYPFENIQVYGISDYNDHLTRLYGDYMTPPPLEKQVSNHSYNLYVDKRILEEICNGKQQ